MTWFVTAYLPLDQNMRGNSLAEKLNQLEKEDLDIKQVFAIGETIYIVYTDDLR